MNVVNRIPSFRVPECVYASDWQPLSEELRRRVMEALGLPRALNVVEVHCGETILRKTVGTEIAEVRIDHVEKSLAQFPITRAPSLWRELAPFPYPHFENLPTGPQLTAPAALVKQVEQARRTVAKWELQLEQQELSTLFLLGADGKLAHAVAFQTVRKKRVRMGLLTGEALEWVRKAIDSPDEAQDGLPRMQAISAMDFDGSAFNATAFSETADTPISTSSASTAALLPQSADSFRPHEEVSRPETP